LGLVAALMYSWEVGPLELGERAVYHVPRERLWEAATDLVNLNTWFSWQSSITPVDSLPLDVGKVFRVGYNLPGPLGQYSLLAKVTKMEETK